MPFLLRLALAMSVGVAVWFAIQGVVSVLTRRSAGAVALAEALIEEESRRKRQAPLSARVRNALAARGWTGMATPLLLAAAFLWGLFSVVLLFFTGNRLLSVLLAAVGCAAVLWVVGGVVATQRKSAFDRQLVGVLSLAATQLAAGNPIQRSLQQATLTIGEPLRGELTRALDEAAATKDLIGALRQLAVRYPSRAFDLFLTALEIDRDAGGRIEPALRQAAEGLQQDFELAQEANAEISQAKIEYVGIMVIMGFIAVAMIGGTDSSVRSAYFEPVSLILLALGAANFAWGVLRAQSMFRKASGHRARKLDRVDRRRRKEATA